MTEDLGFNSLLLPILSELETHLDSLMVIGGWVPQLHLHASGGTQWEVVPLFTTEVDLLLTGDAPSEGTTIVALLEDAGFTSVGDPVTSAIWERDIKKGERPRRQPANKRRVPTIRAGGAGQPGSSGCPPPTLTPKQFISWLVSPRRDALRRCGAIRTARWMRP